MPRRIKPRLGWRYPSFRPGVADDQIKSIYSTAFLAEVSEKFKIPGEFHNRLNDVVLLAGAVYKQSKSTAYARPTLTETQKHFDLMEFYASSLLVMLENMDDASWNFYSKAERAIQEECVFAKTSTAMLEVGALRLVDEQHDDWEFYTSEDLPPVLKLVQLIARRAQADTPASIRGPKRQVALRHWTRSLCDLWESFGRAVTIDYQAGQASSQTYDFLQRLLRPLDGGAVRYLATVLREERTRRREGN